MKPAEFADVVAIIKANDLEESPRGLRAGDDNHPLVEALHQYFRERESTASVLGVDIYRYSKFPPDRQRLVPVVFQYIYELAVTQGIAHEPKILASADVNERFISTGDGGFHIFGSPLQAFVFALYLQAHVIAFNAGLILPKLRRFVGQLTFRYAITRDLVFQLNANWFGAGIISNARVLARDTLNRCLIDEQSMEWFAERIGSFDSLALLNIGNLRAVAELLAHPDAKEDSLIFSSRVAPVGHNNIRSINTQKVGAVSSKGDEFSIYNLHAQVALMYTASKGEEIGHHPVMVTLGNLNTAGISA